MKSLLTWTSWILLLQLAILISSSTSDKKMQEGYLRVHLRAKNIDRRRFEIPDPYCHISLTKDGGHTKEIIQKTEIIKNDINPNWKAEFEFFFDRKLHQYLYFVVKDADVRTGDDVLGTAMVKVADFVDKGQIHRLRLFNKSYLVIQGVNPEYTSFTSERLPLPTNTSEWLRFIVHSRKVQLTDPSVKDIQQTAYVEVAVVDTGASEVIGRTPMIRTKYTPKWEGVFAFNWNKKKNQRLRFRIYDDKQLTHFRQNFLQEAWLPVADYVANGQNYTLPLKKGFGLLHIKKLRLFKE